MRMRMDGYSLALAIASTFVFLPPLRCFCTLGRFERLRFLAMGAGWLGSLAYKLQTSPITSCKGDFKLKNVLTASPAFDVIIDFSLSLRPSPLHPSLYLPTI